MKEKTLVLILDRNEYREKEEEIRRQLGEIYRNIEFFYTTYETKLIRRVRKWKFVGKALQHILYWGLSYKFAREIYKSAANKDVLSINPIVAIFLGIKNKQRKFGLTMCGFLFEPKNNKVYYNLRKKFTQKAMEGMDRIVVYGSKEVEYYSRLFNISSKFVFVPFGMDYFENKEYKGKLPEKYLFSGGGSNRDYHTLLEAYKRIERQNKQPLYIATNPLLIPESTPKGVTVLSDVVVENFGTVLGKADCLILSLKDTILSAGHMVMLQALAQDVPVIVNRIHAVEDYVTDKEVLFFKSGDPEDLAEKIELFLSKQWVPEKTRELYEKEYTFSAMLKRIISLK